MKGVRKLLQPKFGLMAAAVFGLVSLALVMYTDNCSHGCSNAVLMPVTPWWFVGFLLPQEFMVIVLYGGIVLNTTLLYFLVRGVQKFFDIFV